MWNAYSEIFLHKNHSEYFLKLAFLMKLVCYNVALKVKAGDGYLEPFYCLKQN